MKCHDFIKETELTQCIRKTVSQSLLQRRPSVHAHHSTYPNFNLNPSAAKNTGTFWYNFVYKNEEGGPLSTSKNKITFDHQSRHSALKKRTNCFDSSFADQLVGWCFEPSQPQRIISGLETNFSLSPSYSAQRSSNLEILQNPQNFSRQKNYKKKLHIYINIKHTFFKK